MKIIAARDVPCPTCKAPIDDRCTYVDNYSFRGQQFRYGSHASRIADAEQASHVANVLLDS
jgi:hypothetical protein